MGSPKMSDVDVAWHIKLILSLIILFMGTLVAYPLVIRKFKRSFAFKGWALLLVGLAFAILYMFWTGIDANGFLD